VQKGFDPQYGARPLKRAIQKYLEDPMAEVFIRASVVEGDTIVVGFNKKKEEITVRVKTAGSQSKPEQEDETKEDES
jgi:ATP-dependent Clp protease ATP-binding subunit ClpC